MYGFGMIGVCHTCLDIVNSDPHILAKSMQMSSNAEVREYGYRLELALMRQKENANKKENQQ